MLNRKWLGLLAVLVTFGLLAAACGSDSSPDAVADAPADDVELTQDGGILAAVQARGTLNCGVSGVSVGFSETAPDGTISGLDADYCRVVAAAVLGDANAVEFIALTAAERFTAVLTGDVDVLMRNSTWTQSRDTEVGMDFGPTTYFDGQQLMGRASDGFTTASGVADVDGTVICTNAGTTTETKVTQAYIDGVCDIITTDGSGLVGRKAVQEPADQDWVIFPATPISKEPLGPVYAQNDSAWSDAVNWAVYATFIADENNVGMDDVDDALVGENLEMVRLLGGEGELQTIMGLSADAFYNVISQVGNYDEIFSRSLVPLGLTREGSANANWLDGGLIYPPPAR